MKLFIIFIIYFLSFRGVENHGRLMEPPNRSSLWRFKEFSSYNPEPNYNDNELSCGGVSNLYDKNKGNCGPCGDPFEHKIPRDNENTGKYGRGIIVRKYSNGQRIPVSVELTRSHLGYFEFQLCEIKNKGDIEKEECFGDKLKVGTGFDTKYYVSKLETGYFNTSVLLPKKSCNHCVFRWNYRSGNSWGDCGNGTGALGCGNQELFRGCSDINII